ncbi:hypothetical protein CSOJ01_01114 [Colletotrichum sojae]|uniref:Uncharacterized protein n=1 Tax=Colletotrichum sojae TaxID=2175907 RepID=A0A8H6N455_9PEZI|nr:hypothetical protein CSOJ01_01114 [Colletotrichum sojae]
MKDHGRKSNWTAQLSPYLRSLKIKSLIPSPKSPKSPKSPGSSSLPRSPRRRTPPEYDDGSFQIIHTPDRPERPISRTAIPNDEQCMKFLMSLQKQEESKRGVIKTGLTIWPYPDEEIEDRRCLRSVRVESVHLEEARLARTNSSGPARVVEVGRSSTKSTTTARRSSYLPSPTVSDFDDTDELDDVEEKVDTTVGIAPLSPPPTLSRSQSRLSQYLRTPRAQTSRWSDDSESLFSSRDNDSPCPQRETMRSSAEVSSPTMVDDDSAGPSTPPHLTPVKDRPATPFTDPRLRSVSDPTTPPPTDHIVHHISPESLPRNYSWRSSKETVLNTGAPVSRFHSWLPEPRAKEEQARPEPESKPEVAQLPTPPPQARSTPQLPEIEIYGDWADYYFEDGNFWDECSDDNEEEEEEGVGNEESEQTLLEDAGNEESEQTLLEDDDGDEENEESGSSSDEEKGKQKTGHLEVDEGNVYPRYESFIKDYKNNVTSITVTEV